MPTIKQKRATKLVGEGMSVSGAMKKVGYAPSVARTPKKLTESEGYKVLMDKYLPEEALIKTGREGLKAMKIIRTELDPKTGKMKKYREKDHTTRHKFMETGLKLRGKLGSNDGGNTLNLQINFDSAFLPKKKDE